jgi:glycosyltransferase involved in cell wall biosynthesis
MLSITINVKNGARYLARCLNALAKFDDVVVLDNFSTDDTCEIVNSPKYTNVRLFRGEFCGMGRVRNQVASYAKHDWILCVDCDEILHPKLVAELLKMQQNKKFIDNSIYKIRRHNYYDNFCVDGASWGNEQILRLYNRRQTKFMENEVHDSFIMNGMTIRQINVGFMYHFPYDNVAQLIDKMQFYSTLYARQHYLKKRPKLYNIPFRALMMFIKCYILKRGFMYGYEGLTISCYNAMGVFSKYIKLYELGYKREIGLGVGVIENIPQLQNAIEYINQQTLLPHMVFMVIDDAMLDDVYKTVPCMESINNIVAQNLVVPFKIIGSKSQDMATIMHEVTSNDTDLGVILWVPRVNILENSKLLKQCKNAITDAKTAFDVKDVAGVNFCFQLCNKEPWCKK